MTDKLLDQADALMRRRRPPPALAPQAPAREESETPSPAKAAHAAEAKRPSDASDVIVASDLNETEHPENLENLHNPDDLKHQEATSNPNAPEALETLDDFDDIPLLTEVVTPQSGSIPPQNEYTPEFKDWAEAQLPSLIARVIEENIPGLTAQLSAQVSARLQQEWARASANKISEA